MNLYECIWLIITGTKRKVNNEVAEGDSSSAGGKSASAHAARLGCSK